MVQPVQASGSGSNWTDNFDYSSVQSMRDAGWSVLNESQLTCDNGTIKLSGVGNDNAIHHNITSGIYDWNVSVRGKWIAGGVGSLFIGVSSAESSYGWCADGYYNEFYLSVNGTKELRFGKPGLLPNEWNVLSMSKIGNNLSLYYNGVLLAQYTDPNGFGEVREMIINAPSDAVSQYDYVSIEAAPSMSWETTYGGKMSDAAYSAEETADGGFAIVGTTTSAGAGGSDAFVVRTDRNGTTLWQNTYGTSLSEYAYNICATSDGGFAIVGAQQFDGTDIWMVRVNSTGAEVWNKTFGGPSNDVGYSILQTKDGGFVITGGWYSYNTLSDVFLLKVNSTGGQQWVVTYGGSGDDWGKDVIQTRDGGYAIAGWTSSFGDNKQAYLIRTNATGAAIWSKNYGVFGDTLGSGVIETADGFVMVGQTTGMGSGEATMSTWSGRTPPATSNGKGRMEVPAMTWATACSNATTRSSWAGPRRPSSTPPARYCGSRPTRTAARGAPASMVSTTPRSPGRSPWYHRTAPTCWSGAPSSSPMRTPTPTSPWSAQRPWCWPRPLRRRPLPPPLQPPTPTPTPAVVVNSTDYLAKAVMPIAAVIVGAGLCGLGAMATGGNAGESNRVASAWSWLRRLLRLDYIINFFTGLAQGWGTEKLFKKVEKVELEKGVAQERESLLASFSLLELLVIIITTLLLGIAYICLQSSGPAELGQCADLLVRLRRGIDRA